VLEQHDARTITPAKYLKMLKMLVARYPHFIDGYAHLGHPLMEEGKFKLALQACLPVSKSASAPILPDTPG
jgi:hypothetical protein